MNFVLFFLAFCLLAQCGTTKTPGTIKYLALGDSYTIGESVDNESNFPNQLVHKLRQGGVEMRDPKIIAVTGWTTIDLRDAIKKEEPSNDYDLVSLLIGVNDQYQEKNISDYPDNFRNLLITAITLAADDPDRVFVVSIPDYAHTPFGQKKDPERISTEIDDYNSINRKIAKEQGVQYFDITPISRKGLAEPDLVANDDLHPSAKMYMAWVDMMEKELLKKIK